MRLCILKMALDMPREAMKFPDAMGSLMIMNNTQFACYDNGTVIMHMSEH